MSEQQGQILIAAIKSINNHEKTDPALKRRIKKRLFTINGEEKLLADNVPVVYRESYFDKINEVHSDMGHPGVTKTFAQINLLYACIPRAIVEYHIKTCSICNLR